MNTLSTTKPLGSRIRDVVNAPVRWFCALMSALATSMVAAAPTFCSLDPSKLTMDGIFSGMVEVISTIALYVGALLAVAGIFTLVMAYKDDNADGQSRAVRLIVIGIVLIGFKGLLKLIGLGG